MSTENYPTITPTQVIVAKAEAVERNLPGGFR